VVTGPASGRKSAGVFGLEGSNPSDIKFFVCHVLKASLDKDSVFATVTTRTILFKRPNGRS
jgi:hypothetical protein